MKRIVAAVILAAFVVVLIANQAPTAPVPSEVPITWEFDVDLQPLTPIQVQVPGDDKPRTFWYMLYAVTNRTAADRMFSPEFVLYTNTGQVLRAGQQVPTIVYRTIKRVHNEPLLKDMAAVTGRLLQGADNARHSVAIWSDFDPKAGVVDIFVGGLSGESVTVAMPEPVKVMETDYRGNKVEVEKRSLVLTKTLRRQYLVAGEAAARPRTTPKLLEQNWVMR